jgi:hypothetical protein
MKIRFGFVSNSSSSSFVLKLASISQKQKEQIYNHIEEAKKIAVERGFSVRNDDGLGLAIMDGEYDVCWVSDRDAWEISENAENLYGRTTIDNVKMDWFLDEIGITGTRFEDW